MRNSTKSKKSALILPKLHDHNGKLKKPWFVYYSVRDPYSGQLKRIRIYKGFPGLLTREQRYQYASQIIEELSAKLLQGWNPLDDRTDVIFEGDPEYTEAEINYGQSRTRKKTFAFYVEEFLNDCTGIRPSTRTTYKSKLKYFLLFLESRNKQNIYIQGFTPVDGKDFLNYLKTERHLSNKSLNEYLVIVKSLFKFLVREGKLEKSPFASFRKIPEETNKPRIYPPDLLHRIAIQAKAEDPQLLLVIRLIFNCFIRPGEVRKLQLKYIDTYRGKITIPAHVSKTRKQRIVDLPNYLLDAIVKDGYMEYPDDYYVVSLDQRPGPNMVSKNYLYNRFVRFKKLTGIPKDFILYAFKHTGMVELKRSGADWLEVKNQAGHQSLDQTIAYTTELMGQGSEHIRLKSPKI